MSRQQMQICNKVIVGVCATLLLLVTVLSPVVTCAGEPSQNGSGTWYQGGAATNQTSKKAQDRLDNVTKAAAYIGLVGSTIDLIAAIVSGLVAINLDVIGIVLDAFLLNDAKHRKSKLSEWPPELQAAVRQIGEMEDLEGEGGVGGVLDHTEVHVQTLQNAGLEAIQDVTGHVLIEPEELIAATEPIQTGFCMPNVFAAETTQTNPTVDPKTCEDPNLSAEAKAKCLEATGGMTEAQKAACSKRREAHLQMVGTAGVARADLGNTVSNTEKKAAGRLSSYAGSGSGITAQAKVLAGLDLTLAQRLNLINMLQGQEVANEAAIALHELEGMETE